MEPSEMEFLAEKELVTIIPNFSENKISLLTSEYGPFNPSMSVQVPLWLAINLKQRHRCRIQPPDWLKKGRYVRLIELKVHDNRYDEEDAKPRLLADNYFSNFFGSDVLTEKKQLETSSELFVAMPSEHYLEISSIILNNAADDVPQADEIRALIKDIWDLRTAKLRRSIDQMVAQQATYGKVDNLTSMEINSVRSFLTQALDQLHILRNHADQYAEPTPNDSTF